MREHYISNASLFNHVTTANKPRFLQQEANHIAHILQIREYPVRLVRSTNMKEDEAVTDTWDENSSVLEIPTNEDMVSSISHIASFYRFLWRAKHGLSTKGAEYEIDNAKFIQGYFINVYGVRPLFTGYVSETGEPIELATCHVMTLERIRRVLYGKEATAEWIKDVRRVTGDIYSR